MTREALVRITALALALGIAACAFLLVRTCAPSEAVLDQRAAERAAWETARTHEERARDDAWRAAVRTVHRQVALVAAVFLLGNLLIVALVIRATRRSARQLAERRIDLPRARFLVLRDAAIALGAAMALLFVVPVMEWLLASQSGMYEGERGLSALVTLASFLAVWLLSAGSACALLRRRHAAATPGIPR